MNSFSAQFPRKARAISPVLAVLAVALMATPATAQVPLHQIDLSLNLIYNDEADPLSGGTWQVAAKTSDHGLIDVSFYLVNVRNSDLPTYVAPRGSVNGGSSSGPNAGFKGTRSQLTVEGDTAQYFNIYQPDFELPGTGDEPVFYGVGSIVDPEGGVPNFPGAATQFPNATSIGPSIATLANLLNAPWGTGDPLGDDAWAHAALLATGTFDPGQTPSFLEDVPGNLADPTGTVFITLPADSTTVGTASALLTPTYFVRDNLLITPGSGGDYNGDGIVNIADYTVWRDTLGATVSPMGSGADGDNSGIVDAGDYTVWKNNFGLPMAPVGGVVAGPTSPIAVPEPQTLIITVLAMMGITTIQRSIRSARR